MQSAGSAPVPIAHMNKDMTSTTTTTYEHHDNAEQRKANEAAHQANLMSSTDAIPHPVPTALLTEVEKAKGKVPNAHHVDLDKVEHSSVPVGHVQKDPSLFDKMGAKLKDMTGHHSSSSSSSSSTTTTTTTTLPAHDNIPHAAINDATLQEIQKAKGAVPHAHHVDIKKVEAAHAPHVGHVKAEPNILQRATEFLTQAVPPTRPNVPSSALAHTGILQEVESAKGKPVHGHHVDIHAVEAAHQPEGLGHVVDNKNTDKDTKLTTMKPAKNNNESFMDKVKDTFSGHQNTSNATTTTAKDADSQRAFAAAAPAYSTTTVSPAPASASAPVAANAAIAASQFSADPAIAKFNK